MTCLQFDSVLLFRDSDQSEAVINWSMEPEQWPSARFFDSNLVSLFKECCIVGTLSADATCLLAQFNLQKVLKTDQCHPEFPVEDQ